MEPEEVHRGGRQEFANRCLLRAMFHTRRSDDGKKKPSRRKRGQGRRLGRCCGQPRTTSFHNQQFDDMNASFESDPAAPLLVDGQGSAKASKTKELMVAKKKSVKLRLLRTYSLNQQLWQQHGPDWATSPIIIIHKTPKAAATSPKFQEAPKPAAREDLSKYQLSTENQLLAEKYNKLVSSQSGSQDARGAISSPEDHLKECLDLLDLFMVNKSQFLDIIKNKEAQLGNSFLARQTNTKSLRLVKSGSFPAVDSSSSSPRVLTPSMLEHKHMEVWSSPKRPTSKFADSTVEKPDGEQKVMPFTHKRKWIVSIVGGFKGVKQRILKRVLNKGRKKNKRASTGETRLRNWIRLRRGGHRPKMSSSRRLISPVNGEMFQVRRTLSLSESLHKYAPLMERSSSFGNNQTTWQYRKSQSLRLSNEDKSHQNRLKYSFRRRLSLPDLDAILQAKEQDGQDETNPSRRNSLDRKELQELDCIDEIEPSESSPVAVQIDEEQDDEEKIFVQVQEIASSFPSSNDDQKPVENIPTEEAAAESFYRMEGVELKLNEDSADFDYIRDVLEVSGFLDQGRCCFPGTLWYSLDQPLSPLVFDEMESLLQSVEGESMSSSIHRRLLFDLINEELIGIYGSSLTYFPKPLNVGQGSQLMPKGKRVLEEVWKRIGGRRLPEMDLSLFDIFSRDMKRGDGWMNIQLESEDVTLELEDLIMDQLLEEILC
ncbi:unnamed protein product [Linum trigynum]|uniref:DUF4378 domain-containing protein n=1 Tax=Linum trigynum TaxID=586398 RepID=A0AAV2FQ34_9ROSI